MNTQELKAEIAKRLESLNPQKVILFGSYANGTPNADSDIDIYIIKNGYSSKASERVKIRELLKDIKIPKDIIVESEEYFLSHSDDNWINTALYDIRHYGEEIYTKINF